MRMYAGNARTRSPIDVCSSARGDRLYDAGAIVSARSCSAERPSMIDREMPSAVLTLAAGGTVRGAVNGGTADTANAHIANIANAGRTATRLRPYTPVTI